MLHEGLPAGGSKTVQLELLKTAFYGSRSVSMAILPKKWGYSDVTSRFEYTTDSIEPHKGNMIESKAREDHGIVRVYPKTFYNSLTAEGLKALDIVNRNNPLTAESFDGSDDSGMKMAKANSAHTSDSVKSLISGRSPIRRINSNEIVFPADFHDKKSLTAPPLDPYEFATPEAFYDQNCSTASPHESDGFTLLTDLDDKQGRTASPTVDSRLLMLTVADIPPQSTDVWLFTAHVEYDIDSDRNQAEGEPTEDDGTAPVETSTASAGPSAANFGPFLPGYHTVSGTAGPSAANIGPFQPGYHTVSGTASLAAQPRQRPASLPPLPDFAFPFSSRNSRRLAVNTNVNRKSSRQIVAGPVSDAGPVPANSPPDSSYPTFMGSVPKAGEASSRPAEAQHGDHRRHHRHRANRNPGQTQFIEANRPWLMDRMTAPEILTRRPEQQSVRVAASTDNVYTEQGLNNALAPESIPAPPARVVPTRLPTDRPPVHASQRTNWMELPDHMKATFANMDARRVKTEGEKEAVHHALVAEILCLKTQKNLEKIREASGHPVAGPPEESGEQGGFNPYIERSEARLPPPSPAMMPINMTMYPHREVPVHPDYLGGLADHLAVLNAQNAHHYNRTSEAIAIADYRKTELKWSNERAAAIEDDYIRVEREVMELRDRVRELEQRIEEHRHAQDAQGSTEQRD
jgi:hypothetical protein